LPENPGDARAGADASAELHGDECQQRALVAVTAQQHERQGHHGGERQEQQVRAAQIEREQDPEAEEHCNPAPVDEGPVMQERGHVIEQRGQHHHHPCHERAAPDYASGAQALEPALTTCLLSRCTNPVDGLVIEISSIDLASGQIRGKVSPTSGPAAANEHELIGWVSAAAHKESYDNVVPVTFSTTLYEYGTLPVWAGFLRDDKLVTMHYLVWPNGPYAWESISTF